MTAEQLRNSILQEAISGRLVPQDPNDEPASELLARIREEKARLVKEGKLKKKDLVETPITDEEKPFEIPSSWEWVRWGNLAFSIMYGYNAPAEDNGDIRMVRISDIQDNKVLWDKVPFCKIKPSDIETYLLKPNDILFARTGGTVGKSYIVNDVPYPSIYAGYLIRTQYSEQLCPNYLKYFMESRLYWSQLRDETIATAQPNCNGKKLAAMMLPLPPLAEQKRIVAKLEELLPIVEQYGKAQKELDELNAALPSRLRQSILQEAIQGKLVPQDPNEGTADSLFEEIEKERQLLIKEKKLKTIKSSVDENTEGKVDFPDSWNIAHLADICQLTDGEKSTGSYVCLDAKYLRGKTKGECITTGKFVRKGDNIILVDGENSGEVFITPCDGYMGSTFKQLWISSKMYLPYVLYYIAFYKNLLRNSKKGAAIPHLNKDIFYNLSIGIPPLAEQKRIVAKIEELFAEIDKLSK